MKKVIIMAIIASVITVFTTTAFATEQVINEETSNIESSNSVSEDEKNIVQENEWITEEEDQSANEDKSNNEKHEVVLEEALKDSASEEEKLKEQVVEEVKNHKDTEADEGVLEDLVDIGKEVITNLPKYTVTIPESITFGNITKKVKNTNDEVAIAKTLEYEVLVNHRYLFENNKKLSVKVSTNNGITLVDESGNSNTLNYELYKRGSVDSLIFNNSKVVEVNLEEESNDTEEKEIRTSLYGALDQRNIKVAGNYTGTVTFIVALEDK